MIELLVVISIISLLSSIVLSSLKDARAKGRDAARIRAMVETRTALQLYFTDKGYYPARSPQADNEKWKNDLTPYIKAIDPQIQYIALSQSVLYVDLCDNGYYGPCGWYHIAIPLERFNSVLNSDADVDYGSIANQNVDGISNTGICYHAGSDQIGTIDNDLCYDLVP